MLKEISTMMFLAAGLGSLRGATSKAVVGEPPPEFSITTKEGNKASVTEWRGKRVLVFMWASW